MKSRMFVLFTLFIASAISFATVAIKAPPSSYQLLIFEGSDWCRICIKLEQTILSNDAFINFSKEQQIELIRLDFPQRISLDQQTQDYNASMAEKYNCDGSFPTLLLVNEANEEVKKITYRNESLSDFLGIMVNTLKENEK